MKGADLEVETNFCFRVDIDTWEGLHKALPESINLSKKYSFPFTYYLSLGKYATGRNIFRIIKNREPIKRRIPIWKRNHWKDLLRGVLLPPKNIDESIMKELREYEANKLTEFHPHGYNHIRWANRFAQFNKDETSEYLDLTIREYNRIFEKQPQSNAAPNFIVNPFYLKMLTSKQFKFASDFIYHSPFLLTFDKENESSHESIVQLPVTEITIEELMIQGKTKNEIIQFYKQRFQEHIDSSATYVCLYVHAVFEPLKLRSLMESIFELVVQYDMKPIGQSEFYNQKNQYPTINLNDILTRGLKNE